MNRFLRLGYNTNGLAHHRLAGRDPASSPTRGIRASPHVTLDAGALDRLRLIRRALPIANRSTRSPRLSSTDLGLSRGDRDGGPLPAQPPDEARPHPDGPRPREAGDPRRFLAQGDRPRLGGRGGLRLVLVGHPARRGLGSRGDGPPRLGTSARHRPCRIDGDAARLRARAGDVHRHLRPVRGPGRAGQSSPVRPDRRSRARPLHRGRGRGRPRPGVGAEDRERPP